MPPVTAQTPSDPIFSRIHILRAHRVILDADLAGIYGVPTKRLNEQVKRNAKKFPADFMFRLTAAEKEKLVANCDHLQNLRFTKALPHAFTEHGALMAATLLNSPKAVAMSVYVIRAFVRLREELATNQVLEKRLAVIEKSLLTHDTALRDIISKIRPLLLPPPVPVKRRIGFHPDKD